MISLAFVAFVREDFAPAWEKVADSIRTGYYARKARHTEMERLLAEYAPVARAATSRADFERAVNAMIAEFGDSHFELTTPEDQGYYLMDDLSRGEKAETMPQIGAWFRRADDGYTVQMVLEGGAAERAGLRVGDLVTRIDGRPFTPVASLEGEVGKTATFGYRREGREETARVEVTRSRALRMFLDATLASRRIVERRGKRIGVVHIWTLASKEFAKALAETVATDRDTDGFVLDLRGGFGGRPEGYDAPFAHGGYEKPLAVIVDRGSRSAKEILSYEFQKSGRATLVGETTAGNVLGTSPTRLNDWAYLEIPRTDVEVGGVRLEGHGVKPDVAVPPTGDPVERAVEILTGTRV